MATLTTTQAQLFQVSEIEVGFRPKYRPTEKITSSREAYDIFAQIWQDIDYCESMYIMVLNRANKVMGVKRISEGSVSGTVADPKKIFQIALKANASAVIIAHNHPSGNNQPSNGDRKITEKAKGAGVILDLPLLDHLILTPENTYTSFADEGLL